MDESTDGVTLLASSVLAVVDPFRDMQRHCAALFELVRDIDPSEPDQRVPIATYNEACDWIEQNLGVASLRSSGAALGRRSFQRLRREGAIAADATPAEALAAFARSVRARIQDPKKRGWEILESNDGCVLIRRTQTFNCVLQEGVLLAIAEGTNVTMPRVEHLRCTRRGEPFCEYEVRWLARRSSRMMTVAKL